MTFATDALIAALRLRYDYYSAQSVFELARERAGIAEKPALDATEVRALCTALPAVGDRLDGVLARIGQLLAEGPATAAPVAPVASKPPVEPKVAPKAAAETKPALAAPPALLETTIVLTGVEVGDGEQVLVCGAFAELGDWDPERARPMARKGDAWLTTVALTPDTEISFKFLRRTAEGEVIWEGGENRSLVGKPRVDATWR